MKWCNKHFLGIEKKMHPKKGILVLVGGGSGAPKQAIESANIMFKMLNANFDKDKDYICSLNTNNLLASKDADVLLQIDKVLEHNKILRKSSQSEV